MKIAIAAGTTVKQNTIAASKAIITVAAMGWNILPSFVKRQLEDERLMGLIKHSWLESGCVYGYRKVTRTLRFRELAEHV
ncbi:IS3 family transposase [Alteromonas mediterranea 615]|uniref:IS3 family transposase n=1 Tax=Alteromonas mediterranea 615 TaxID=1300253 RepID=S5A8F8_9ALTE|nr:IS3 family transposase [Alteromonas mediterranea 615]